MCVKFPPCERASLEPLSLVPTPHLPLIPNPKVDGLEEAKAYLTLHARGEVRRMIRRAIEAWAASSEEAAGGAAAFAAQLGAPPGGAGGAAAAAAARGSGSGSGSWAVSPALHGAVGRLMKAVFDQCLRALADLGRLLQEFAEAPPDTANHAVVLLKQQGGQQLAAPGDGPEAPGTPSTAAGPPGSGTPGGAEAGRTPSGGFAGGLAGGRAASSAALERLRGLGAAGYVRAEYDHVWEQMQEEVQLLLAELLHAQLQGPQAALGERSKGASRWLAELAQLATNAAGEIGSRVGVGVGGAGGGAAVGVGAAAAGSLAGAASPSPGPLPSGGADGGGAGSGASRLVFSLEVGGAWLDAPQLQRAAAVTGAGGGAVGGAAAVAAAAAEVGAAAKQAHSYGPLLSRALAGHRGGPYLTPAGGWDVV
jgi:hypothetical protein